MEPSELNYIDHPSCPCCGDLIDDCNSVCQHCLDHCTNEPGCTKHEPIADDLPW